MTIRLATEARNRLITSVKRYFAEALQAQIGDLKADLLLDFCLKEICPLAYNQAIADAQAFFLGKVEDLEGSCFEPEFAYWDRRD